jgi:hypothetical protein
MRWLTRSKSTRNPSRCPPRWANGFERSDARVAILEIDVVDQDSRPDAPVSRADEVVTQDSPRGVGFPEEVLDVEGLLGEIGQDHAGRERRAPVPDDCHARFAGVLRGKVGEFLADRGGLVEPERRRLGSWVVFRHGRTARDQQEGSGQQGAAATNVGAREREGAVLRDATSGHHHGRIVDPGSGGQRRALDTEAWPERERKCLAEAARPLAGTQAATYRDRSRSLSPPSTVAKAQARACSAGR